MEGNLEKEARKGTTTIGLVCKDGIVLVADRRVSAGYFIASKKIKKIYKITTNVAVTTAGMVSDAQLVIKLIQAELRLKKIRTGKEPNVKESANLSAAILYSNIRRPSMLPSIVGMLLGGKDEEGFHLFEIGPDGSITEADDFISNGSGSPLAYGVLEAMYQKNMSLQEAIKLATKAINSAIQRDMPTGDGIDIVTITEKGVEILPTKQIERVIQ